MLTYTYFAQNYSSIICQGLLSNSTHSLTHFLIYSLTHSPFAHSLILAHSLSHNTTPTQSPLGTLPSQYSLTHSLTQLHTYLFDEGLSSGKGDLRLHAVRHVSQECVWVCALVANPQIVKEVDHSTLDRR